MFTEILFYFFEGEATETPDATGFGGYIIGPNPFAFFDGFTGDDSPDSPQGSRVHPFLSNNTQMMNR